MVTHYLSYFLTPLHLNGCLAQSWPNVIKVMTKFKKGAEEILRHDKDNAESKQELDWLEDYMPKQLTEDELIAIIKKIQEENPDANMGVIMKELKIRHNGQYDGKRASTLAREMS